MKVNHILILNTDRSNNLIGAEMNINIEPKLQTSFNTFFPAENSQLSVKIQKIIVPIYQREYDWKDDEILRLLSDLDAYISTATNEQEESYFTGAVILEKLKINNNDNFFEVVDGQQRLTTLYLLNYLAYIITCYRYRNIDGSILTPQKLGKHIGQLEQQIKDKSQRLSYGVFGNDVFDAEESDGYAEAIKQRISTDFLINKVNLKFEINEVDQNEKLKDALLQSNISEHNSRPILNVPVDNRYGENLIIIFNHLFSTLEQVGDNNDKILEKISNQIELYLKCSGAALIISENKDDSFKLFEVLNDTARKLTVLDLLKNYFVESLDNNYNNEHWKKLKEYESKLKSGTNLINDLIKSEGCNKATREYTYLSNQNKERVEYFRMEPADKYFNRLLNVTINLNAITKVDIFNPQLKINSLNFNLSAIHSLKFHWGRQTMLAIFNLSELRRKTNVPDLKIWDVVDHNNLKNYEVEEQVYLVVSDLLIKIGLVSKVNHLSSKALPEIAKKILDKFISLLSTGKVNCDADLNIFISDVKGLAQTYFQTHQTDFSTNLKSLRYTNTSHRSIFKHLLFFLYNKGQNCQYQLNKMSLEHIEPQTGNGVNYFQHPERDSFVNSFGNIVLIGQSKNSSFGNKPVSEKLQLVKSEQDYQNDAFITHRIFTSLDLNQSVNEGTYSKGFYLLRDKGNYINNIPTEDFFKNRMKFYEETLLNMIFNNDKFLLTGLPY